MLIIYTAKFYLIYLKKEETVSIAKESSVIESSDKLTVGDKCHVRHGQKVVEGIIVTHGKSQIRHGQEVVEGSHSNAW